MAISLQRPRAMLVAKAAARASIVAASIAFSCSAACADPAERSVPSRVLPVPDTVSPEMQRAIGSRQVQDYLEKVREVPAIPPPTSPQWQAMREREVKGSQAILAQWRERLGVTVTEETISGVHCYVVTPAKLNPKNRNRILIGLHGGGYMGQAGESGTGTAIQIAGLAGLKVILVDYRLAPEHPFPAAIDDATAVWREVAKRVKPKNLGLWGDSAGGGLALALVQRAKREGLPLPAAIAVLTPLSDMSKTGDSYFTNAWIDNTIGTYESGVGGTVVHYPGGRDLTDPLLSPVYGDFSGFPPTMLITGTRDLFLSNTVRVHRKLRQAGIEAQLEVYEGQSHDQFRLAPGNIHAPDAPEAKEIFTDMGVFFDAHLGR